MNSSMKPNETNDIEKIMDQSDYLKRDIFFKTDKCSKVQLYDFLKEISPEYSLGGLMLKLKLQYFGHLMRRTDSLEKTLMPGKIESKRRGWQRMRWLDGISYSMDMSLKLMSPGVGDGQGGLACCSPWGRKEWDRTEWLKWTELNSFMKGLLKQYLFLHLMIFKYAMCKDVGFFSALFLSGWGKSNWS